MELERFEFELCECALGAHVETVKTPDGSWVRFEDVQELLGRLSAAGVHVSLEAL